jgi:hypothetical protein
VSLDVPEWVVSWSKDDRREYWLSNPPEGMTVGVWRDCNGDIRGSAFLVPIPEPAPAPAPAEAAVDEAAAAAIAREQARARVEPRPPRVGVSPQQAVVRLPTWLWVEDGYWRPRSASEATPSGVAVGVRARPLRAVWDLVEGVRVCDGPGMAWSPAAQAAYDVQPAGSRGQGNPACTFTFVNASSMRAGGVYDVSVTVVWEFDWSLDGAAQGVFGTVEVTSAWPLTVGEVQTVITG